MDFNNILKGYKEINIKATKLSFLLKSDIKSNGYLNQTLIKVLALINMNITSLLDKAFITEDGMKIELSKIKQILNKYLDIKDTNNPLPELQNLLNKISSNNITYLQGTKLYKEYKSYVATQDNFLEFGRNGSVAKVNGFLKKLREIIEIYIDILNHEDEYSKILTENIDEDKLKLYIATILTNQLSLKKYDESYKKIQNYIRSYLYDNKDLLESDYSFTVRGKNKTKITYSIRNIYKLVYQSIYKAYEETPIEQTNYTFFQCDKGIALKKLDSVLTLARKNKNNPDLLNLLERKIELYTNLGFNKIMVGMETFSGYIGFVLPNGYVILDKLFDNIHLGRIAYGNAIYIIKEEDFSNITKMSKIETINAINNKKIAAVRFIHNELFEQKVMEFVRIKKNNGTTN